MEIQAYVSGLSAGSRFEHRKGMLQSPPLSLEVREEGELFTVMTSATSQGEENLLRQCAGPVFEKQTGRLVGYGLDRADEIHVDLDSCESDMLDALFRAGNCQGVFEYVEGVKLTVYRHAGAWMISTTRMINAFKSTWSSAKSFGSMFMDACAVLYPALFAQLSGKNGGEEGPLDISFSYAFVLASPDHKIVRANDSPIILHVGTFDLRRLQVCSQNIGVTTPVRTILTDAQGIRDELGAASELHPGYMIIWERSPGCLVRVRVLTTAYKRILELRGNTPDDIRHYLETRGDKQKARALQHYYPEFQTIASHVEDAIAKVSADVYELYVLIFIRKTIRPAIHQSLQQTLQQIHAKYLATRLRRTPENVYALISGLPAARLHRLLKQC